MDIGNAIKGIKKEKGFSQEELALGAEVSRKYMYSLEAGKASPTVMILQKIATCLDIKVSDIIILAENN